MQEARNIKEKIEGVSEEKPQDVPSVSSEGDEDTISSEELGEVYVEEEPVSINREFGGEIQIKKEDTRGKFALAFLLGFFIVVIIGIVIGIFADSEQVDNASKIILTISGILSGPLGFIVGYYFKKQEEETTS